MSTKLNVMHMCLSTGFGGLEMYPIRAGKTMMAQGHNVFGVAQLNTPTNEGMVATFQDTYSLLSRGAGYRSFFKLAKWIKKHNIGYVHCHKSSDLLLAVLLKKRCGFVLIYTDHMGVKRPKKDFYHKFIYRHVDLLLSISHFTRQGNIKALPVPPEKIKTLWLGTDILQEGLTEFDLKKELSLSDDVMLIGIVGRITQGKGHKELLQAFNQLLSSQTHLIIVGGLELKTGGDQSYADDLKRYVVDHRLEDKVTFYGFSDQPDCLLRCMDVVVIPSHLEAFGLTVIEAMAMGKAIIGSKYGAIPEILADSGIQVDPFDTVAFAKAIDFLCQNSGERERLSALSKLRAQEFFDQQKHVQSLLALYQEC
ncbi:glycosyltransferase family 4 protein [Marinomonas flavescens]|uniref:glycosyltransferase family 4 protein n=1 Tax=Marinomonas flavescens TaxID=2529379 RepID=UPI00105565BD|nr:glycosyltransferase family 4 protein [Marinomonas flavescens]